MDHCGLSPLFGKVSFLHFHRCCARYVCLLTDLTIVIAFPPAALPAFIGTTRSSDSLLRICLPHLLSLVGHTHFHVRQNRVSRVTVYSQSSTCHALRPRGGVCNSPVSLQTLLASEISSPSPSPIFSISRLNHLAFTYGLLTRSPCA